MPSPPRRARAVFQQELHGGDVAARTRASAGRPSRRASVSRAGAAGSGRAPLVSPRPTPRRGDERLILALGRPGRTMAQQRAPPEVPCAHRGGQGRSCWLRRSGSTFFSSSRATTAGVRPARRPPAACRKPHPRSRRRLRVIGVGRAENAGQGGDRIGVSARDLGRPRPRRRAATASRGHGPSKKGAASWIPTWAGKLMRGRGPQRVPPDAGPGMRRTFF